MRQLLLFRHAKAAAQSGAQSDHARPLTARGRSAAAAMRTTLRSLNLIPDVILVSSARRTLQTLEALSPWDETPLIEPMDGLYLATPGQLLAAIASVAETVRSLMVIGHNPGLHELASALAGAHDMSSNGNIVVQLAMDFPTGALAEFAIAADWRVLHPGRGREDGAGRLIRFIRPRDLPGADPN